MRKTLEFYGFSSWSWVKKCSLERLLRWYQQFSKKMILKGTYPILKFWNVLWFFSTQKRVHGLKFCEMVLFLKLNLMPWKFSENSKILVNLGIISESHQWSHFLPFWHIFLPCLNLLIHISWPKLKKISAESSFSDLVERWEKFSTTLRRAQ